MDESFSLGGDGVLRYQNIFCLPNVVGLRSNILVEAHGSMYSIHPGSTNMYHDLKAVYWWEAMKRDISKFMEECTNFQQVKAEHNKPGVITQTFEIPTWKLEAINVDFLVGLQKTRKLHDSIWVIIDRMTKSA